ncbi:MAG TPA: DUF805 domain-containing protein [Alphaproteobacteria bacterium]|nr:DUF805 domain-containing protein [Alphaproteobacteria bacterium]
MNYAERTLNFLFNPFGRIPRAEYIAFVLATWLMAALSFWKMTEANAIALGIFFMFPTVCVAIRRWHDFDHTGWWLTLRFAPLLLLWVLGPLNFVILLMQTMPIAVLVMECVMPGTRGANRYGPQPMGFFARRAPRPRTAPAPIAVAAAAKLARKPFATAAKPSRPVTKPVKAKVNKVKAKAKPKAKPAKRNKRK